MRANRSGPCRAIHRPHDIRSRTASESDRTGMRTPSSRPSHARLRRVRATGAITSGSAPGSSAISRSALPSVMSAPAKFPLSTDETYLWFERAQVVRIVPVEEIAVEVFEFLHRAQRGGDALDHLVQRRSTGSRARRQSRAGTARCSSATFVRRRPAAGVSWKLSGGRCGSLSVTKVVKNPHVRRAISAESGALVGRAARSGRRARAAGPAGDRRREHPECRARGAARGQRTGGASPTSAAAIAAEQRRRRPCGGRSRSA